MSSILIAVLIAFFVIYILDIDDVTTDSPPPSSPKEKDRDSVDFDGDGF